MAVAYPIQRRYIAEQLVCLPQADERRRYAAAQRQGRIDPDRRQAKLAEINDELNKNADALQPVGGHTTNERTEDAQDGRKIDLVQKIERSGSRPSVEFFLPRG